jgi:hypothetical protein
MRPFVIYMHTSSHPNRLPKQSRPSPKVPECQLQAHSYADMTYGDLGGNSSGDSLNLLSLLVSNESRHSLDSLLLSDLLYRQLHSPGDLRMDIPPAPRRQP